MSDLTDLIGGSKKPINIQPSKPTPSVVPPTPVVSDVSTPLPTMAIPTAQYDLLLLVCGGCGTNLSVGKTSPNGNDRLHIKCPVCSADYEKHNYIVDSTSVLFHRPFTKEQQSQFDKEIDKLKKSKKVQTEVIKTQNNQ